MAMNPSVRLAARNRRRIVHNRVLSPSNPSPAFYPSLAAKRRIGQAKALVSNRRRGTRRQIRNVFCPTGAGGGIDATCSPDTGGTFGGVKTESGAGARKAEILKEANRIQFSDERIEAEGINRNDYDAIEEAMTADEKSDMQDAMQEMEDSAVESYMAEYEPGLDWQTKQEIEFDTAPHDEVSENMADLIREHGGDKADDLLEWHDDWERTSDAGGESAIQEVIDIMRKHDAPDEVVVALKDYRADVADKVQEAITEAEDSQREEEERNIRNDYDSSPDRHQYLADFWSEHNDESRFTGEGKLNIWGRDHGGDRQFSFETSNGNRYDITAYDQSGSEAKLGFPVKTIQFSDASGSFSVTGAGQAHEVFSHVTAAVVALVKKENVEGLHFTAAEKSRQRLYDRLVKTIAAVAPEYAAVAITGGHARSYIVAKRELLEANKSKIPASVGKVDVLVNQFVYLQPEIKEFWFSGSRGFSQLPYREVATNARAIPSKSRSGKAPNPLKMDPTKTATLRRLFISDLRRRFKALKARIIKLVVGEDAFGLVERKPLNNQQTTNAIVAGRWQFDTNPQKVDEFRKWLESQVQAGLLQPVDAKNPKAKELYWQRYIEDGYRKGIGRAYDDFSKKATGKEPDTLSDFYNGSRDEFMRTSFGQPETIEKVQLLTSRTFTDLKGITDQMATVMSRTLADGLVSGANPRDIADDLTDSLDLSYQRAETIARTEIIRAHAEGQLDALQDMGVEQVGVMVEWSTAGDDRVCELCEELEGVVLEIAEAHNLIPRHPNCRCSFIPANVGEDTKDQERTKEEIDDAIAASAKKETGEEETADALDASKWAGADLAVVEKRSKSILNFNPNHDEKGQFSSLGAKTETTELGYHVIQIVSPDELQPTEFEQTEERLDAVRQAIPAGGPYPPVIAVEKNGEKEILDGHHRWAVASERGDSLPVITLKEKEFRALRRSYGDQEIGYAALKLAGEKEQLAFLKDKFSNSDTIKRGDAAAEELNKLRQQTQNTFCPTGPGGGIDPHCEADTGASGRTSGLQGIKGSGTKNDPYRCGSNIEQAAKLLSQGKHIRLKQPDQVATLIDKMQSMIQEAMDKGENAPQFDLCKVSAKGTNLFCQETLGIPRIQMPQMRGIPLPGTYAATLPAGKKSGKVDLSADFISHLAQQGITTKEEAIPASHLRASQNQIVGARVVQLITETQAGTRDLREKPIFVTRDNYIVDGHHHWAAIIGYGAEKGKDFKIPVYKLDMEIGQALEMANEFTKKAGLAPKSGATTNVFCPTGPGGGVDPSCAPDSGGTFGGKGSIKLPASPKFISSQKDKVAANEKAVKEMRALAKSGKLTELEAHAGTPSPKVQAYKESLVKAVKAFQGTKSLPATPNTPISEAKALKTQPSGGGKPAGIPKIADIAAAIGRSEAEVQAAVKGGADPSKAHNAQVRAEVTAHLLTSGGAVPDAVTKILDAHDKQAVSAKVASLTTGNVSAAQKEFADTPMYDLQVLSKMTVQAGPVSGEAVCNMASRSLTMGSTTRSGSYRHELGHAIHSALAGKDWTGKNANTEAITNEYKTALGKVKSDPPKGVKLSHEEYETKYGVVGARGLDNDKENFAEHYRLYHRELYRDRNEGGNGKFLAQYRERHPGMAKIFDAHYTTALLGQE